MKVLVYPLYDNPYQPLLYGALEQGGADVTYVRLDSSLGVLSLPARLLYFRLRGFKLLHLHWQRFAIEKPIKFQLSISFWSNIIMIELIKMLRFKVVWTVHNVLPHETQTTDDAAISRRFSALADAKIVHSSQTIDQMRDLMMDVSRTHVIPHGSYISAYKNEIGPVGARQKLGISPNQFVALFLGQVRSYKGVEHLISVVSNDLSRDSTLVIAGVCADPALAAAIEISKNNANIIFHNMRVPDADLEDYFNACDVVCLPFKSRITTSGSALLALSFGRPIVAPLQGALVDLPTEVGYFYDPDGATGLRDQLLLAQADSEERLRKGAAGLRYADTLGWSSIAQETLAVYRRVLDGDPDLKSST